MPPISTYPIISIPALDDLLIGTDTTNFEETKNFRVRDISSLVVGNFIPYTGATGDVNLGSFGITANSFVKLGGTSLQFLKADGSVDSTLYTPQSRTITINGVTYDLSGNRSWYIGAVESLSTAGTEGASTLNEGVLNIPQYQSSGNYITQLSGEATGAGPGAAAVVLSNSAVISKVLTGFNTLSGPISASDSILQAFGKAQSQINALASGVSFRGVWNASTNTPTLTSGSGTGGHYYVVSVSGTTNLNGNASWSIGDWVIFNGNSSVWQRVPSGQLVSSVNGYTGAVSLNSADTGSATATRTLTINGTAFNLTADRAWIVGDLRSDSTYGNPSWITSLDWSKITGRPSTLAGYGITNGVYSTNTITINGVGYDLSANRSWSVGTVKSVSVSGPLTGGTITNTGTIGISQASSTASGYLSAADWNMFNNKLASITANAPISFASGIISISQAGASASGFLSQADWNTFNSKQGLLVNPITGLGTSGKLPIFTGSGILSDSIVSYSANSLLFSYNSTSGNSFVLENTGIGSYSYAIVMDNYGLQKSTTHQYGPGNIVEVIGVNQVRRVFENGNTVLGVQTVDNGNKLSIYGTLFVNNVNNSTVNTNKFLVHDSGVVKFRTASEVFSEIGSARQITINGVAQNLSVDRSWSVGTVTSVSLSAPVGFAVSGSPVTGSGSLSLAFASGYSLPTVSSQASWDSAFNNMVVSAAVSGTTTKTLTLTQQDGGTVTASWTESGGVGTIGGSGAAGQVSFFTGASAIGGDNGFFWDNTNKRLGLGTATPGRTLDVHGTNIIAQFNGTTTNNAYLDFQNAGSAQWRIGNTYNAAQQRFSIFNAAGTTETFTILQNGSVGVNTTTPSGAYGITTNGNSTSNTGGINIRQSGTDVMYIGNIAASNTTDFEFWNPRNGYIRFGANNIERMRITSGGRVLMGATLPTDNGVDALQVNGSAIATRLKVNTNGQEISISTYYNTGGNKNIWIGNGGASITTAYLNVSLGVDALLNNTSGYSNVAIGADALKANTTGFYNFGIGASALFTNSTGNYNMALGASALAYNTTGSSNTAVGSNSMSDNYTGSNNVAIGDAALYWDRSGSSNVALGQEAGRRISNGSNNTTPSQSIYIGQDTRPSADGNTNEMVFGHTAIGQGSNTVTLGNSSITKTFLRGRTMVNTTTDNGVDALQVNGRSYFSGVITANSDMHMVSTGGLYFGAPLTYVLGITGNTSNGNLSLNSGSATRLQLGSSGRILAGVTLPTDNGVDALQVNGSVRASSYKTQSGTISLPSSVNTQFYSFTQRGVYIVKLYLAGGNVSSIWTATAIVSFDATDVVTIANVGSTNVTIIVSGTTLQGRNIGSTFTFNYDILRMNTD